MMETFKLIKGQRMVEIGDRGTVRRVDGFIYSPGRRSILVTVNGRRRTMLIHRAMWEAFVEPLTRSDVIRFKNGDENDLRMDNLEKVGRSRPENAFDGIHGRVGISMRPDYESYVVRRDGRYIGLAHSKEEAIEMWEKNESKKERRIREYNEKYK